MRVPYYWRIFITTMFLCIFSIAVGFLISNKLKSNAPHLISCNFREMIIIERALGHQWPAGSVSGCRCLVDWNGKIYMSYELENRTMCTSEPQEK